MRKLFRDCDGGVITTELVLVASFMTAALMTNWQREDDSPAYCRASQRLTNQTRVPNRNRVRR